MASWGSARARWSVCRAATSPRATLTGTGASASSARSGSAPVFGALSGIALGLGLGTADLAGSAPGYGGIVLRDTLYGTGLGAVAGAIAGGISAFAQDEAEHVLFGTALGALSGAGVGMIIGFIEAPRAVRERKKEEQRKVVPAVSTAADARNQLVWMFGGAGRF